MFSLTGAWSSKAPVTWGAHTRGRGSAPSPCKPGWHPSASRATLRGFCQHKENSRSPFAALLAILPAKTPKGFFLLVCTCPASPHHPTRSQRCLLTSQQTLAPSHIRLAESALGQSQLRAGHPRGRLALVVVSGRLAAINERPGRACGPGMCCLCSNSPSEQAFRAFGTCWAHERHVLPTCVAFPALQGETSSPEREIRPVSRCRESRAGRSHSARLRCACLLRF